MAAPLFSAGRNAAGKIWSSSSSSFPALRHQPRRHESLVQRLGAGAARSSVKRQAAVATASTADGETSAPKSSNAKSPPGKPPSVQKDAKKEPLPAAASGGGGGGGGRGTTGPPSRDSWEYFKFETYSFYDQEKGLKQFRLPTPVPPGMEHLVPPEQRKKLAAKGGKH